jgi:hypothetical protein
MYHVLIDFFFVDIILRELLYGRSRVPGISFTTINVEAAGIAEKHEISHSLTFPERAVGNPARSHLGLAL